MGVKGQIAQSSILRDSRGNKLKYLASYGPCECQKLVKIKANLKRFDDFNFAALVKTFLQFWCLKFFIELA